MLSGMNLFLDSFWRAVAYSVRPRVIALSFLPLVLLILVSGALVYFFWDAALVSVQGWLSGLSLLENLLGWLEAAGAGHLRSVLAPLVLLLLGLPLIIVATLLAVAGFMTPALVSLVAERRFPHLQRYHGGSFWRGMLFGLGSAVLALLALLVSMPLWLIPPLVVVLPPLIWGWLTYRVMTYDTLIEHAAANERAHLLRRHRLALLAIGVLTGYLGAAPGLVWAVGAMAIVFAPLLVPLAIWIYTYVFAFSSLWFAHYCLAALAAQRTQAEASAAPPAATAAPVADPQRLSQETSHRA